QAGSSTEDLQEKHGCPYFLPRRMGALSRRHPRPIPLADRRRKEYFHFSLFQRIHFPGEPREDIVEGSRRGHTVSALVFQLCDEDRTAIRGHDRVATLRATSCRQPRLSQHLSYDGILDGRDLEIIRRAIRQWGTTENPRASPLVN